MVGSMKKKSLVRLPRRRVLQAGTAAAAAFTLPSGLFGCGPQKPTGRVPKTIDPQPYDNAVRVAFAPAAIAEDGDRFPMGVQAGAMRALSVLLWTQTDSTAPTRLRVWREVEEEGQVALVKDEPVAADANGFIHVPTQGLAPATVYRYGFFSDDLTVRGGLGRFRTAYPDDWREPLTFSATACTHYRNMPFRTLARSASEELDLFLHLGDISYNDEANYPDDFRRLWRRTLQDEGYRALLSSTGWYACWDDHETSNNLNPEREAHDPRRLNAAVDSFYEALAVERGESGRHYKSYRWGQTAEFFVLDCRTERKPSTRETADAEYLSPEQLAWLTAGLAASPAHFKIVLNSVPIAALPPVWVDLGDRWQGYPAQREKLLSFIDQHAIENVWFIAGDFHMGMIHRVEADGPRRRMWEICAGPGGNANNPLSLLLNDPQNRAYAFPAKQFEYASGALGTTFFTLDPEENSMRVRFIDPATGEVRYDGTLRQEA